MIFKGIEVPNSGEIPEDSIWDILKDPSQLSAPASLISATWALPWAASLRPSPT